MSRLDDLPPDQRATLSLLLRTRKSYAEVAALLGISEQAVHDRAHAALAVLAAPLALALSPEQRAEVGDYLLSQRDGVGERLATRSYLDGSPPARAWANALAAELAPLSDAPLPEIPAGAPDDPPAAPAREPVAVAADALSAKASPAARRSLPAPPSSRRAGALLLAAIVVVVVVLVSSGGGSSGSPKTSASGSTASTSGPSSGSSGARAKEDRRVTLTSPDPASKAVGVAEVLSEGSQYAFYLAAEHLAPSKGFFYAVWLYNSPTSFEALSRAPNVGSNGNLQGGALLPKDAGKYHTMLLTRETKSTPTSPGPVVLSGVFGLH
ncbi:MAG TPA: sigma factor-like helix-turn-helix DNA-binding protein [Solirubrobacteraceae bacterium]|jgi:hypothetical protein|nr:sigma factor-like helix-turn-helix DNA-binding protein [Solirubrobacteraceae bacterium]